MRRFAWHLTALAAMTAITLIAPLAPGDIVHLKDGTKLEGEVKHSDDGWTVNVNGKVRHVHADEVQSIELSSGATGPRVAEERLASLRRSVENLTDIKEIISRYQRFIDQTQDPAALGEAKKDLAVWQDRLDQNMVKAGTKWVSPRDRDKLAEQAASLTEQGRQLIKQGRAAEAEPLLNEASADDPQNASPLYLLGLLRYQQEQIPAARKLFDAVAALAPNHAPTLNNLGVVQWRQRQYMGALNSYDGAMLAAPVNKEILDNVASALQSLPTEYQNSAVTQKATRHFQEQDRQLAETMAQGGLHRVGAIWVSDKDLDAIRQQQKQVKEKLDAMATEFDKSKEQADDLDRKIEDTESQMHRIEATSYAHDPVSGTFLRLPYPAVYFDLQRDDQRFRDDRAKETQKMDALQQAAKDLQKRSPVQKQADVQRMIGPEGTPLRVADVMATTRATSQPAGE